MAPKQAMSKKNKEKKKSQAISDATFGLKNKNKSAKVQGFVKQVETTMKNNLSDAVSSDHFLYQRRSSFNNHSILNEY